MCLLLHQLDVHPSDYFKPKDPKGKAPEGSSFLDTGRDIGFYGILSGALKSGVNSIQKVFTEYLNPFSEYNSSENRLRNKNSFEVAQLISRNPDQRYYPYTSYNKYDSWFEYTKKLFYESKSDKTKRFSDLKDVLLKGTSSDLEASPTKSVRFDLPNPQESSKQGFLGKMVSDLSSAITNKTNVPHPTPISPPLSPEDLANAGADVWNDHPSRSGSPSQVVSNTTPPVIINNIPTADQLSIKINNIMKSGVLMEHLAEYSYGPQKGSGAVSSKLGPMLEGSRPSIFDDGVMLPLHVNDPLNFLNNGTVFDEQWFNWINDKNVKLDEGILAVRNYLTNTLFEAPSDSSSNTPQQGTSNLPDVNRNT